MNALKSLLLVAILLTFSLPARCASPEADVRKVVETFYRDYLKFAQNPPKKNYDEHLIKWVETSPYTSAALKKNVAKALRDARKADPELGLESDPILAGQDYPEKGYRAASVRVTKDKASAAMEGIGTDQFHISVSLINEKGQWLIDSISGKPSKK